MRKFFALLALTASVSASADSMQARVITLDQNQSTALLKNLSTYAAKDGSIRIDRMVCRGAFIAYECDVIVAGEKSSFGYTKSYRVFQALSKRLNPIIEVAKDGSNGLYNITVTDLVCQAAQDCTLSTTLNDRLQVGR